MSEAFSNKINRYNPDLKSDPWKGFKKTRTVRIIPKKNRFIPDILPNNGRIYDETVMELNPKEILRCLTDADVYEILEDGTEKLITIENMNDTNLSDIYDGEGVIEIDDAEDAEQVSYPEDTSDVGYARVNLAKVN